jgi:hypothetical protein
MSVALREYVYRYATCKGGCACKANWRRAESRISFFHFTSCTHLFSSDRDLNKGGSFFQIFRRRAAAESHRLRKVAQTSLLGTLDLLLAAVRLAPASNCVFPAKDACSRYCCCVMNFLLLFLRATSYIAWREHKQQCAIWCAERDRDEAGSAGMGIGADTIYYYAV